MFSSRAAGLQHAPWEASLVRPAANQPMDMASPPCAALWTWQGAATTVVEGNKKSGKMGKGKLAAHVSGGAW